MASELPEPTKVVELLSSLLGCDIPFTKVDAASTEYLAGFTSLCLSDEGEVVFALAADARAGAFLGGKLMMLPNGPLEDAAESGELDEILVDALSEVFNNLTVPFNAIAENPHIASRPAKPTKEVIADDDASWIENPSTVLQLGGDVLGGQGSVFLIAK